MPLSGVAGAREVLLPHCRIAHCAFLSVPRGLETRFSAWLGTYRGRGAKARSRWQDACFLLAGSQCVGVAGLPCQRVAAMLHPGTVP